MVGKSGIATKMEKLGNVKGKFIIEFINFI